jgi:hypothetical protein
MSPTNQKTFTFVIPGLLKEGLQKVKERDGITEAEQIRRAIVAWLVSKEIIPPPHSARAAVAAQRRKAEAHAKHEREMVLKQKRSGNR